MSQIYGIVLLVFLVSTYLTVVQLMVETSEREAGSPTKMRGQEFLGRVASSPSRVKIVAFLIVAALWVFQDRYRHRFSPQAKAVRLFDELLDSWDSGRRAEVIGTLDAMAMEVRPWEESDYEDDDRF